MGSWDVGAACEQGGVSTRLRTQTHGHAIASNRVLMRGHPPRCGAYTRYTHQRRGRRRCRLLRLACGCGGRCCLHCCSVGRRRDGGWRSLANCGRLLSCGFRRGRVAARRLSLWLNVRVSKLLRTVKLDCRSEQRRRSRCAGLGVSHGLRHRHLFRGHVHNERNGAPACSLYDVASPSGCVVGPGHHLRAPAAHCRRS